MTFTALDYIADQLHQRDSQRRGEVGPRWWCLRGNLRVSYRAQAKRAVANWAKSEKAAESSVRKARSRNK